VIAHRGERSFASHCEFFGALGVVVGRAFVEDLAFRRDDRRIRIDEPFNDASGDLSFFLLNSA